MIRLKQTREVVHLWLAVSVAVVLSAYRLSVHLIDQLREFFQPYTDIPVADLLTNLLFIWLIILLWLAYRRWRQAIHHEQELERVISSISPDVLLVVSPDRVIRMCNSSVQQMFGYDPAEIIGKTTDILYFDRRVTGEKGEISRALERFGFHVGRATGRRKNQEQFPLEIVTGDVAGQPGAVILMRDITERNRYEGALRLSHEKQQQALRELRDTQRQIIQQERLRVLGQMASYIAHEFNNALTPIMGFTELLLSQDDVLDDRQTARDYLQDVYTAAQDASAVVRRLREFYSFKDSSEHVSPVDLNEVIQEAISLTRPRWKGEAQAKGRDITITTTCGDIPTVYGNREELHEVLTNLIFNAVGAMPHGGTISIMTHADDTGIFMEVSDTGHGMSDEVHQRCMEPFFTTMGSEGTGLGLVVVSNIVQRHHGTISFTTTEGVGTTFSIRLPLGKPLHAATRAEPPELCPCSLRILVVDDEPLVRKLMTRHLTADGHTAETATNGAEALAVYVAGKYDAVITDWAMPEMNGSRLADEIRSRDPKVPIIMMTGFDSGMREATVRETGVDLVIGKPVTRDVLRRTLHRAQQLGVERNASSNT